MKNIYMGSDSVAGIQVNGKVDEDWEVLINIYATAYDAINNDTMLTHTPQKYDEATIQEVNGRFAVLYKLVNKYAPHLRDEIRQIHELTIKNLKGKISDRQMLSELRKICRRNGVSEHILNEIEAKIDAAERFSAKIPEFNFKPFELGTRKSKAKPEPILPQIKNFDPFGLSKKQKPSIPIKNNVFDFVGLEKDFNNMLSFGSNKTSKKKNKKKTKSKNWFEFKDFNFEFKIR